MSMKITTTTTNATVYKLVLEAPKTSIRENISAALKRVSSGIHSGVSRFGDWLAKPFNTLGGNSASLRSTQLAHNALDNRIAARFPNAREAIKAVAIPADFAKMSGAQRRKINDSFLEQKIAIALNGNVGTLKPAVAGRLGAATALNLSNKILPEMAAAAPSRPQLILPRREDAPAPDHALQQRCDMLEQKFRALSDGKEADAINRGTRSGSDADLKVKISRLTRMLALYGPNPQA